MTTEDYALELETEAIAANEPCPKRHAFIDAISARGTDARTKQFKHYDRIVEWMLVAWQQELG